MEHRIVSLIASATEIVASLGYARSLVGRSHECDYPPAVTALTICSEPRIDVSGTSGEIDRAVKTTVREALSVYSVFRHELERLQPTIIITQTQCDVCAVNLRDVEAAICDMIGTKPKIVSLEPMCLTDVWLDIGRVAIAIGDEETGKRQIKSCKRRLEDLGTKAASRSPKPTVFCLEWLDPLMSAGNWVPELLEIAGGQPVLCEAGKHSPYLTWDDLLNVDPDIIAIMPCGFGIERTQQEMQLLTEHPYWPKLKAVQTQNVYLTDGNQYFNRPGPRLVESAEILFDIIHRDSHQRQHGNHAWIEYSPSTR